MITETKTPEKTYGASDLAKQLNVEPRAARQVLRRLARTDQDARLRVNDAGKYAWTKTELNAVAKKIAKAISKDDQQEKSS